MLLIPRKAQNLEKFSYETQGWVKTPTKGRSNKKKKNTVGGCIFIEPTHDENQAWNVNRDNLRDAEILQDHA